MNRILKYKLENNLTYKEIADECGVDAANLARFAIGKRDIKNMTLETAAKLCKGMGIENPLELLESDQE